MKKDIIFTTITQALALVSLLISFKLVSYYFSEEGFLLYSTTRRNLALIVMTISLGLSISLIKCVSSSSDGASSEKKQYLTVAIMIFLLTYLIVFIFVFVARLQLSQFFYADYEHTSIVLSLYIGVGGLLIHGLVYSYFRGRLYVKNANIIDIANHALVPIIGIMLAKNINEVFVITGVLQFVLSFIIIGVILYKSNIKLDLYRMTKKGIKLLKIGIVRVPAEAGMVALLSFSAVFVTHFYGLKVSGYFSFSLTLVTTISYLFLPLGIVLLPRILQLRRTKTREYIINIINITIATVVVGGMVIVILLNQFMSILLEFLSVDINRSTLSLISLTIISSIGYSTYSVLKNIIDALYIKGINSINVFYTIIVFSALLIYLLISSKVTNISNFLYVFNASFVFLGLVSIISIYRKIYYEK